ncbi:phosphatase PAP2 family protein [Streptomyces polygonati]|uniref:Phosphatase PAP2 family protein n=1 Tax=Streptomyces polygonati TaxID=1617087 RepID=A0ABV8HW89_9ACTN
MGEPPAKTTKGQPADPSQSSGSTIADPAGHRTGGSLRHRLITRIRTPRSPRLWFEVLLIGVSYWLYSQIRNAVPQERTVALAHASDVWDFERSIGLGVEHAINHGVNSVTWLIVVMNYFYSTLHFIVTISVLAWLYLNHPGRYGPARTVVFMTTWLALLGFWLFPLAPPRLLRGGGFIDTVREHHTWGSVDQGKLSKVSNQFAAMPSLHIGWSLWCGITVATLAAPLFVRILAGLYPALTLLVIISTGNHFWLDAVGGAFVLGVAYTLAYLVYGRWVYRMPRYPQPAPG